VLAVLAAGIAAVQTPDGQPVAFVDRADDYRQPIKLD
jgi:hypothetical protein